jgi:hypothetical protein
MAYLWATLLILLNLVWLATVVAGLPGTWLMVVSTALLAWLYWGDPDAGEPRMFSIATLIVITALAAIAELVEFIAGAAGSQTTGGTWRGSLGALLGGLVGAIVGTFVIPIPIPLVGTLIGAAVGAGLGAWGLELAGGRQMGESAMSGVGAGVGTLVGRVAKLIAGIVIWLIVAVAAFWP